MADVARMRASLPGMESPENATRYVVTGDDHSGHGLPVGTEVTHLTTETVEWFTQGGDGDEVAIDPRDLRPITPDTGDR
jgi:hypothetical protein